MTLLEQLDLTTETDPGPGGWSGGFANQAHWDPERVRTWRCWAQTGPTWSAACQAEVAATSNLGLCEHHRQEVVE